MDTGYVKLLVVDDSNTGIVKEGDIVWGIRHYLSNGSWFWDISTTTPPNCDAEAAGMYDWRFKIVENNLTQELNCATIEEKEKRMLKTYVTLGSQTRAVVPQEPVVEHLSQTTGRWIPIEEMATEHIINSVRKIMNGDKAYNLVKNEDLKYLVFELATRFAEEDEEEF